MKLVFAGTPQIAVPSLALLAAAEYDVVAVITRADAPLGRKRILTPSPIAQSAAELALPVLKANRLGEDETTHIAALQPDLGVIVAYGALVREPLLRIPRLGWINLHFSLLPRWRGASPVQRAVIAGDETIGATVFQLVQELDAGPVFNSFSQPLGRHATSGDLLDSLGRSGARLLGHVVNDLAAGRARAIPQFGDTTHAPKLTMDDARIDWSLPAQAVYDRVRGVTPEPGAFTMVNDARLKLLSVAPAHDVRQLQPGVIREHERRVLIGTAGEPLELVVVQPAGKSAMKATDWWRGVAAMDVVAR